MTKTESIQLTHHYASLVRKALGINLKKVVLFGSRARNEGTDESDFDIALVVNQRNPNVREKIIDAEIEMLNRYDVLFASLVYETHEWEREKDFPLGWNILKDGIEI